MTQAIFLNNNLNTGQHNSESYTTKSLSSLAWENRSYSHYHRTSFEVVYKLYLLSEVNNRYTINTS